MPETIGFLVLSGLFFGGLILGVSVTFLFFKRRLDEKIIRLDQAGQKAAQSEARFRSLFEDAPFPFGELDVETGVIHFNRCFTDTFGYADDEVPDLDAWWPLAYPDPEYRKEVQGEWEQAVRENRPIGVSQRKKEFRIWCKNGEEKNVIISATLLSERVLVSFFDISDLKYYQSELEKSLNRFRTLFDLLPFSCVINGMDGRYLLANKYFCETARKPFEQIVGRTMEELGRTVDPEAKETITSEIKKHGSVSGVEMTVHHGDSQNHILFSSCLIDWKGERAILSSTVDITDRKKAEEALRKSQERLTLALDAANDGLWDLNLDSEQMYCSPNYYRMLGYEPGEFPDTLEFWKQSLHPDDRGPAWDRFLDYLAGRTNHYESEFRIQTRQGEWKWLLSRGRIVEGDETGSPVRIVGTHVDITEKKLAETALKESEENLRVTLNSIGDAVIATDLKGKVTRMNPIAHQLTGWAPAEAAGRPLQEVFHIVNAQTEERVESPVEKVLSTGKIVGLANHTLLISRSGARYQIADSGSPIRNARGKIIGVVLVFRDVTGEYEMQERLRQAQKMEAIGVLAGGIAHDFNNILSALMGFTDLARLEAGDKEPIKSYLDSVSSAGLRARDLVRHILTFSRKTDVRKQLIYIDPIIKETLKFIRASLPANIDIRRDLRVGHARVWGDATQFHQILMNLFTNAGHAMKDRGGKLEVILDAVILSQADILHFKYIKPGRYFQLIVSDTGRGIPKAVIDRIFEPFFTTKQREEGTGMGLSTVYGILKEMGGGISVYSEVGVGTTFKVLIPEQQQATHTETALETPLMAGKGRILIVDDEALIIEGTREILSKFGYSVTGSTSSHGALKRIEKNPWYFDLVLTDMTMPGMNGLELSRRIRSINSEIPIVLCTGFSEGLTKEMCGSAGISDLVMKPMIASELLMAVHRALKTKFEEEEK